MLRSLDTLNSLYTFAVAYATSVMTKKQFDLEDIIGYLLARTHRVMANRLFQNLKEKGFNITPEQWMLLVHLWQSDGLNQNEIAQNCGKDKTTITRAIDNLEKAGLVKRVKDKEDGRVNNIHLTEKAKDMQAEVMPVIGQTIEQAQKGIGLYDMEITKETLRKIYDNLSPYEDEDLKI